MKEKLPLESLPHFVEEAVADMSRGLMSASPILWANY